jgi:hypothetical protein
LEVDRDRPTKARDDDPQSLLDFQSTSDSIRYRPDPHVLRQIVDELKRFRRSGFPDDFIRFVERAIIDCFRRLDALPREDPFWDHTNRRPTFLKLIEFSNHLLRADPSDVAALGTAVAMQILLYGYPDPRFWMQLHGLGQLHTSWPIYAALYLLADEDPIQSTNLMCFLRATGLDNEAVTTLQALMCSQSQSVSRWAKGIMEECTEPTDR